MGLLDDAIREHLDLKRRRGADPSEVERAEREALGPVRREPESVAVDDAPEPNADLGVEDELAYADGETEWDSSWEREPDAEAPAAPSEPVDGADEPPAPAPAAEPAAPPQEPEHPEAPDPHRSEPFDHGEETAEYDVPGELQRESRKEGDDVLEETPDFLQDTPDHDRLWFEQKPPRDFDFDG